MAETLHPIVYKKLFNCYLVVEDDGLTLVDTSLKGAAQRVLSKATQLAVPIRRIVLTHAHQDHVGGVPELMADGIELIAGRREGVLMAGDLANVDGETTPIKKRHVVAPAVQPTRLVDEGELIGSLQVINTPGHTPGHISLLDVRDHTLIAGDAVTTLGGVGVSGQLVWRWPFPALATWDKAVALRSGQRLLELEPRRLATGHGPVLADGTAALRAALS